MFGYKRNYRPFQFHTVALLGLWLCTISLLLPTYLYAETAEKVDPLKPALEATPSSDGLCTWWLVSGTQKGTLATLKPPLNARDGSKSGIDDSTWKLHISPPDAYRHVDLKPFVSAHTGVVWSSVRLRTQKGTTRTLRVGSPCALKVFRDGQLVLEKPLPTRRDETEVVIDVPVGDCELTVGVEIRSGWAGFQFNVTETAAHIAKPRVEAGDRLFLPLKAGTEPKLEDALASSTLFITRDALVMPGQTITLYLVTQGSLPAGLGVIEPIIKGINAAPLLPPIPARPLADIPRGIIKVDYLIPKDIEFASVVTVDLKSGEKVLATKKLTLYSLPSIRKNVKDLETTATQTQVTQKKFLPNTFLALDKLNLYLTGLETGKAISSLDLGENILSLLELAKKCLQDESASKDPFDQKVGFFERAYTSIIDEQAQPYQVHIPAVVVESVKKKDGKKFPLVVFLHGYVPNYDKHHWLDAMPEFNDALEQHECLYAAPFGRTNTDFQSCGEVDVMDVIAEMKRLYPVDGSRVYLYGYSMGGMAVYTIAAHHPDTFAAAVVFCGRADSPLQNKKPLADFHPFKQWLIHADNPISLCENLLNLPLRIYHGKEDSIINISEARRIHKRLTEIGAKAELIEFEGDHWAGYDLMAKEDLLTWMFAQKKRPIFSFDSPIRRHMKAYQLRHAFQGAVWVTAFKGTLTPIELEWTEPTYTQLGLPKFTFSKDSDQIVLRETLCSGSIPKDIEGPHKRPELCGPVREAICGPFVLVYGTSGSAESNKINKENAERFAKEWFAFTRSKAILKADKDLSDSDKKSKNLFLFGAEDENLIHAAAPKLPIKVKAGQVTIGEKTLPLEKRGLLYIYPSPFADGAEKFAGKTSVVICAGLPYGRDIGTNHKLDLVPDFLLYGENSTPDGTGTNQFVCAGFFNGEWKFEPTQTWWEPQDK